MSGEGVSVRLVDYYRVMGNQELGLLRQQLNELQKKETTVGDVMAAKMAWFEFPAPIGPEEEPKPGASGSQEDAPHRPRKKWPSRS